MCCGCHQICHPQSQGLGCQCALASCCGSCLATVTLTAPIGTPPCQSAECMNCSSSGKVAKLKKRAPRVLSASKQGQGLTKLGLDKEKLTQQSRIVTAVAPPAAPVLRCPPPAQYASPRRAGCAERRSCEQNLVKTVLESSENSSMLSRSRQPLVPRANAKDSHNSIRCTTNGLQGRPCSTVDLCRGRTL